MWAVATAIGISHVASTSHLFEQPGVNLLVRAKSSGVASEVAARSRPKPQQPAASEGAVFRQIARQPHNLMMHQVSTIHESIVDSM